MAASTNFIYTVSTSHFDVGGTEYPVSFATLTLSLNSIPTCTVGIAPAGATEDSVVVNTLSVRTIRDTYEELGKKAVDLTESSLHIVVDKYDSSTSSKIGSQSIELNGWLLIGVGLSELNVTTGFSLTCTIAHPAYNLTRYAGFFFSSSGTVDFKTVLNKITNPVDAGLAAIDEVILKNSNEIIPLCEGIKTSTPIKTQEQVTDILKEAMQKSRDNIEKYLRWDSAFSGGKYDLPGESEATAEMLEGIKYALADMWLYEAPGTSGSAWDTMNSVAGLLYLDIVPTYMYPELTVTPSNPWKEVSLKIDESDVSDLTLPSIDPAPIFGVIQYEGNGAQVSETTWTYQESAGQHTYVQPTNLAFVPADNDISSGKLIGAGTPGWVLMAMHVATALSKGETFTFEEDTEQVKKPMEPESGDSQDLTKWNTIKMMCLASMFMKAYRAQVSAQLQCPFMTRTEDGALIIPGKVMSFHSEGGEVFTGHVESVMCTVNCERSIGSTHISVSYCSSTGYTNNVLGSSPQVPLFGNTENGNDSQ